MAEALEVLIQRVVRRPKYKDQFTISIHGLSYSDKSEFIEVSWSVNHNKQKKQKLLRLQHSSTLVQMVVETDSPYKLNKGHLLYRLIDTLITEETEQGISFLFHYDEDASCEPITWSSVSCLFI